MKSNKYKQRTANICNIAKHQILLNSFKKKTLALINILLTKIHGVGLGIF